MKSQLPEYWAKSSLNCFPLYLLISYTIPLLSSFFLVEDSDTDNFIYTYFWSEITFACERLGLSVSWKRRRF